MFTKRFTSKLTGSRFFFPLGNVTLYNLACVASVSVRFRSKERGTRFKDRAKNGAKVKERGGGEEERKETLADKPRDFENHPLGLSCLSSRTDI